MALVPFIAEGGGALTTIYGINGGAITAEQAGYAGGFAVGTELVHRTGDYLKDKLINYMNSGIKKGKGALYNKLSNYMQQKKPIRKFFQDKYKKAENNMRRYYERNEPKRIPQNRAAAYLRYYRKKKKRTYF